MSNGKSKYSFLIAWLKQLGDAYESFRDDPWNDGEGPWDHWRAFVELVDLALEELATPDGGAGDGADVDEAPGSDGDGGESADEDPGGAPGSSEDSQPTLPGLVRGLDSTEDLRVRGPSGVPRGTRGGDASGLIRRGKDIPAKRVLGNHGT